MATNIKKSNNSIERPYRPGDFYASLSQADKEAYTYGTIKCKGNRRVLPEHILKKMAQPKPGKDVIATLGHNTDGSAISPDSNSILPKYYSPLELVPTATCYICGTTYKLSAIRYHRAVSLEPEQPICQWCYRDVKDSPPEPKPAAEYVDGRGYTGTKAITLEDKLEVARIVLSDYTKGAATYDEVDAYVLYLGAGRKPLVELYFDKRHKLMADQRLVEDFIDQLANPSEDSNLEEFEFIP